MTDKAPPWGIEPVPDRLRVLGLFDTTLLWTNLGVSLLVLVLPAYFGLSLKQALLATLVGGLIGNSLLALAGLVGADGRVPAMVLQRAPLGRVGSYAPTALNVLQCLGWAVFEIIVIATAAGLLAEEAFGVQLTWLWKLVFGALAAGLAFLGPISVVRRFLRKYAVWVVVASIVYLAWWILDGADLGTLWDKPATGGSFWLAVDLVVAVTVSWAPLAPDYTRFASSRRSAFLGTGFGYLLPTLFQFGFGSILVLSREIDPHHPELILTAIAGAGVASGLALLALTVDETDEAFANVYSTAVSLQNVLPRVGQRLLIAAVAAVAVGIALVIDLRQYERFLLLLGAIFVPLLGVLVGDWLLRGRRYTERDVFGGPRVRPFPLLAWVLGFLAYEWCYHSQKFHADYGFWSDLVERAGPPSTQLPASIPGFGVALGLMLLYGLLARRGVREPRPQVP